MKVLIDIPEDYLEDIREEKQTTMWRYAIANGKALSYMTNGDVFMAMFPDAIKSNYIESGLDMKDYVIIYLGDYEMRVSYDWWDAPYKEVEE